MAAPWHIVTFYKFLPIAKADLEALRDTWKNEGEKLGICGLFLMAEEGVNTTLAGEKKNVEVFIALVEQTTGTLILKESEAEKKPFRRWKVSIREEIVAIGNPSMHPIGTENTHISPAEWDAMLEQEDVVVIDARNTYETDIGMFKNAIDPKTNTFLEFPEAVKQLNIPKDKKIMMYCTGEIRCEKASMEMKRQGYEHVYQLQGGILGYLNERPDSYFQGECFVFDHRVAVDQHLKPSSQYGLCVFCGDPGDVHEQCSHCEKNSVRCKECAKTHSAACSKRCISDMRTKRVSA